MSMTPEEAIEYAESKKMRLEALVYNDDCKYGNYAMYSGELSFVNAALSALRPVSRERVEKVWSGCQMCEGWNTIELKPCANGDLGVRADIGSAGQADPFGLVVYNNLLASGYVDFQFCPFCGSPKTADAVQMVMERLEAQKDGKGV